MGTNFTGVRQPPPPCSLCINSRIRLGLVFQKLLRFPARKGLVGSKPYLTLLSIDEHNLYYQGKDRVSCPEGSRTGIMLYNLK